jgi:hypothetical protein
MGSLAQARKATVAAMRQRLVLCGVAALAAAQRQCTEGEDRCAAAATQATQRFRIDINVDGESKPIGFLRGDDLNDVARRWVAANSIEGEDAVRTLVTRMRAKVEAAPALDGEALGCPALAYEHNMEPPPSLAAFARRAVHIAGPDRHIILTMATGGYVDFARSWARGLDLINVSHFLVAALDDVALTELKPLGGHVEPVYEGAMAGDAPGRDAPAAYGSGAFRALTQIKPALVLSLLEADLSVLYADADVAFLRDPWPHLASYENCAVALQPNRRDEEDVLGAIVELDRRPGNPRPRQRYYGDVGCSGLAYFPASSNARRLAAFWAAAASAETCGGDQAGLEAALAFLAYAADDVNVRALPLLLFPNGMALRTLYDAPAPEALIPFEVPSEVVAFHANYVVGASQKRAWLESLGLWFG